MATFHSRRESIEWVKQFIEKHPEVSSVDEIARVASEARYGVAKEQISKLRRKFEQRQKPVVTGVTQQPSESIIPSLKVPRCTLCHQEGHWASQCPQPPVVAQPEAPVENSVVPPTQESVVQTQSVQNPLPTIAEMLASIPDIPRDRPLTPDEFNALSTLRPGEQSLEAAPNDPGRQRGTGSENEATARRRAWLSALLDKKPGLHPRICSGELFRVFGLGVNETDVYAMCRTARAGANLAGVTLPPLRDAPSGFTRNPANTREPLPPFAPQTPASTEAPAMNAVPTAAAPAPAPATAAASAAAPVLAQTRGTVQEEMAVFKAQAVSLIKRLGLSSLHLEFGQPDPTKLRVRYTVAISGDDETPL